MKRVIGRLDPTAPHEVLLVLDAGQGQNALAQAQQFHAGAWASPAWSLTKLDGTAKGGIVLAIADALGIPIRFIGVGERPRTSACSMPSAFVDAVLGAAAPRQTRPR